MQATDTRVLALCGGVGGAKLALGFSRVLAPGSLLTVVNTGDDFEHLGLRICPDLDTVMYTLAGIADRERGWGLENETWNALHALESLDQETWFRLGDRDLATHLTRTNLLAAGHLLTEITARMCASLGVTQRIVPMSDASVRTFVQTDRGNFPFQHYFVRERCEPRVQGFQFAGVENAPPQPDFLSELARPGLEAVVICPSNPFVSIAPILALPGVQEALRSASAPVLAVSPIVSGKAVKGPAAKMMAELGMEASAVSVAAQYRGLIDGFVIDSAEATTKSALDVPVLKTNTLMLNLDDRERLAAEVLEFAARFGAAPKGRDER